MENSFKSFLTKSYWKYALFKADSIKTGLAFIGACWGIIEMLDYFGGITRKFFPNYSIYLLLFATLVFVVVTRRPLYKIRFKVPGKDTTIHVIVGDLFKIDGQKVISTNTTFDTDIANGIISDKSIQGQFTNLYFPQNIQELDLEITTKLQEKVYTEFRKEKGKTKKYPIGTTVRINQGHEKFYLVAMADMNEQNTASTTITKLAKALDELWDFMASNGEMENVVLPLVGTGRGRLKINRKALIVRLAHSFIEAYSEAPFCKDLIIVIHPSDMDQYDLNLFQIKDLLDKTFS